MSNANPKLMMMVVMVKKYLRLHVSIYYNQNEKAECCFQATRKKLCRRQVSMRGEVRELFENN